jgi:hypothetical protein
LASRCVEAPTGKRQPAGDDCGMDSSNNGNHRQRALDREIERYREACVSALDQLEWIVGYLHRIHRPQIARTLDRNRKQILKEVRARG